VREVSSGGRECEAAAAAEGFAGELITQPVLPGQPASVAVLCGPGGRRPLWPTAQRLSADGRVRYLGGTVPLGQQPRAGLKKSAVESVNVFVEGGGASHAGASRTVVSVAGGGAGPFASSR